MNDPEDKMLENLRNSFARDEAQIDADTAQKLRIARQEALKGNRRSGGPGSAWQSVIPHLVPAAALASALFVIVGLWQFSSIQNPRAGLDNFEMSADLSESELELVEDLEFYEWLDVHGYAG